MSKKTTENYKTLLYTFIAFFASFGVALCFSNTIFVDPDAAWHLKAGELILTSGKIPMHDTWIFSSTQQWYNISWSWDILTYLIYQKAGFDGLFITQCILFALVCVAIYRYALSINGHQDTATVVATLSSLMVWDLLYFRPQILTYFFCIAVLYLISTRDKRAIFICPIIMILWVNIHGSFLGIYSVFGAFFIQAWIEKDRKWQKEIVLCALLCFAAIFINPVGYKIFIGVHRTMDSVIKNYILEWKPMTFGMEYSFTLVMIIMLLLGGFMRKDIPIAYRILAFAWLIAGLDSRRFFGYFAVFSIPYLSYMLLPFISANPSNYKFSNKGIILVLILVSISPIAYYNFAHEKDQLQGVPVVAIDYLNKHCKGARVLNDYGDGAFLAFFNNGKNQHMIDGRAGTAFDEKLLADYIEARFRGVSFEHLVKEYKVNVAMFKNSFFSRPDVVQYFSKWSVIYKDGDHIIYQKPGAKVCR
jgi:hypothetical protein